MMKNLGISVDLLLANFSLGYLFLHCHLRTRKKIAILSMAAEDVIFYFDLGTRSTTVVSKKAIVKQVNKYIKDREKEAPSSNYGIITFNQGEDNPLFQERLAKDETELETFFQDNLKFSTKAHPIEQGLMLASTYLIETFRIASERMLRLIVISDGPTEGSTTALFGALMDLVDSIKYFPVFIDIVRIGDQRIYPDDIRLKTITDETCGLLRYAASEDAFRKAMNEIFSTAHRRALGPIPEEKRGFFEALCWLLVPVAQVSGICTVCGQDLANSQEELVQCDHCCAGYHAACVESRVLDGFVFFPGITRCDHCKGLVKVQGASGREQGSLAGAPTELPGPACEPAPEAATPGDSEPRGEAEGSGAGNDASDSEPAGSEEGETDAPEVMKGLRSLKGTVPDMVPLHEIKPAQQQVYRVEPEPPVESNDIRVVYIKDAPEDDDPKIVDVTKHAAKKPKNEQS
jgi:hypothetical protein